VLNVALNEVMFKYIKVLTHFHPPCSS